MRLVEPIKMFWNDGVRIIQFYWIQNLRNSHKMRKKEKKHKKKQRIVCKFIFNFLIKN